MALRAKLFSTKFFWIVGIFYNTQLYLIFKIISNQMQNNLELRIIWVPPPLLKSLSLSDQENRVDKGLSSKKTNQMQIT